MGASGEDEAADEKEEYDDDGDRYESLEMDRPRRQFCREALVLTNISVWE